ncbi:NADH:ubiquinone oxidoreductase 12.3kD subunit [Apiospora hydei]|uniref:NADH:ubiquinone oxidoreductase 12.3kD subunit n=1 Tax=Apiospora hydei TaxID=1337664 RepID=A0ABR1X0N9_9PEZI
MPTPESEAFLAKKPKVPPTFDGVDYDDNKALKAAQDSVVREQWVQVMMGRLVREELSKCYYREGVNHLEKCGHLREKYLQMLDKHRVRGFIFEQQNYSTPSQVAALAGAADATAAAKNSKKQ